MPYITVKQSPRHLQMTLEEMLAGASDLNKFVLNNESNTHTYFVERPSVALLEKTDVYRMIDLLDGFNNLYSALYEADRASLYRQFYLPKKSGGLRQINAPNDELMSALYHLKAIFETHILSLAHTTAFAYVRKRSIVDAVRRHQANESKWFLKLDFADFFPSTTHDFVMRMFSQIFPFSEIVRHAAGRDALSKTLDLCFLNGGLPMGTPISPFITNVMMIAIDHKLNKELQDFDNRHFVYTRYADDLIISCKIDFCKDKVTNLLNTVLAEFDTPFSIKHEKTRYGSSSGRNWNLGLMLNKDKLDTRRKSGSKQCFTVICVTERMVSLGKKAH